MSNPSITSLKTNDACAQGYPNCEVTLTYKQENETEPGQCTYKSSPEARALIKGENMPEVCDSLKDLAEGAVAFEQNILLKIKEGGSKWFGEEKQVRNLSRAVWNYVLLGQGDIRRILEPQTSTPRSLDFLMENLIYSTVRPNDSAQKQRFYEFVQHAKQIVTATNPPPEEAKETSEPEERPQAPDYKISSPFQRGTQIEWQESQVRERDCPEGNQLYTYIFAGTVMGKIGEGGCDSERIPVREDKTGETQCVPLGEESKIFKVPPNYQMGQSVYVTPQKSKCVAFVPVANFTVFWPVKRFSEDAKDIQNTYALRGGLAVAYPKYHSPAAVGFVGIEGLATTFDVDKKSAWKWGPSFGAAASFGGFKGSAVSLGPTVIVSPVIGDGEVLPVVELGVNSTLVGLVSLNGGCQFAGEQAFLCGLGAGFTPLIFGE